MEPLCFLTDLVASVGPPFASGTGHVQELLADVLHVDLLVLFEDFFLLHRRLYEKGGKGARV